MKVKPAALCALTLGLCAPAARAADAPLLQPTGKWIVDYGDTNCSASRAYGTDRAPLTLGFSLSPSGRIVRVVVGQRGRPPAARYFHLKTNAAPEKTTGLRFPSSDRRTDIIWINLERPVLDRFRDAGEIALNGDGVIDRRLALPQFAAVLKALDQCNADLRRHWNAGADGEARLSRPAKALKSLHKYVSHEDYPAQALFAGAGGTTSFTLLVDETGSVKDCAIEETSGIASIDAMSCLVLINRAKFEPALDLDGKPARSVVSSKITWRVQAG